MTDASLNGWKESVWPATVQVISLCNKDKLPSLVFETSQNPEVLGQHCPRKEFSERNNRNRSVYAWYIGSQSCYQEELAKKGWRRKRVAGTR